MSDSYKYHYQPSIAWKPLTTTRHLEKKEGVYYLLMPSDDFPEGHMFPRVLHWQQQNREWFLDGFLSAKDKDVLKFAYFCKIDFPGEYREYPINPAYCGDHCERLSASLRSTKNV